MLGNASTQHFQGCEKSRKRHYCNRYDPYPAYHSQNLTKYSSITLVGYRGCRQTPIFVGLQSPTLAIQSIPFPSPQAPGSLSLEDLDSLQETPNLLTPPFSPIKTGLSETLPNPVGLGNGPRLLTEEFKVSAKKGSLEKQG